MTIRLLPESDKGLQYILKLPGMFLTAYCTWNLSCKILTNVFALFNVMIFDEFIEVLKVFLTSVSLFIDQKLKTMEIEATVMPGRLTSVKPYSHDLKISACVLASTLRRSLFPGYKCIRMTYSTSFVIRGLYLYNDLGIWEDFSWYSIPYPPQDLQLAGIQKTFAKML